MRRASLSALNQHLALTLALGLLAYLNHLVLQSTKWQGLALRPTGAGRDALMGATLLACANRLRFLTLQGRVSESVAEWDGAGVGLFLRAGLAMMTLAWLCTLGKVVDQARSFEASHEPGGRLSPHAASALAAAEAVGVLALVGV